MAITLDDIKKMPPKRKALIVCAFYLLLGGIYFSIFLQSSLQEKGTLDTKLSELREQVAEKERLAAQKGKFERELNALREAFKIALTKLPDQREIPGLLYSVAEAGKECSIDFLLFEPKTAERKPPEAKAPDKKTEAKGPPAKQSEEQFYEEIPVKVSIVGGFHNTVRFFEKIAGLPRIVNVEDIAMSEAKSTKGRGRYINTLCTVKTYMFLEKVDGKKTDGKK